MKVTRAQLGAAPEIALLAAVDHSLELAARLLHVAHPWLHADPDAVGHPPFLCDVARRLLDAIDHVRQILSDYHNALEAELSNPRQAELPF